MQKEIFKNFLVDLSKSKFSFLESKYHFTYEGLKANDKLLFYEQLYKNNTTGVVINFDIKDGLRVYIVRLQNKEIGLYSSERWFLADNLRDEKFEHKIFDISALTETVENPLTKYADLIEKYGEKLLRGDFAELEQYYKKHSEWIKKVREKTNTFSDANFRKYFENICKQFFSFLSQEYNFHFSGTDIFPNNIIECSFSSEQISINISCQFGGLIPAVGVAINRLHIEANNKLSFIYPMSIDLYLAGGYSKLTDMKNLIELPDIGKSKSLNSYIENILAQYVDLMKKHCHDILTGKLKRLLEIENNNLKFLIK